MTRSYRSNKSLPFAHLHVKTRENHMKMDNKLNKYRQPLFQRCLIILLSLCITIHVLPVAVYAHPPSTMTLSYNLETQDLFVNLSHQVSDPATHYISQVEIKKNGVLYNTSFYSDQPTSDSFSYIYKVTATAGDSIEVYAECNLGGSRTAQYTILEENSEDDTATPGFEVVIFLCAILAGLVLLRKKYS